MLKFITPLLASFLVLPLPAFAADLTFSLGGGAEYDSNVFRREADVEDDYFFRIIPAIKIHEDRGQDVNFSAGYQFPVEFAVKNSNQLNDYDHLANGKITYHVNDRLEVFASEDFRYLRSILRNEFDTSGALDAGGIPLIDTTRDRVTLNDAALGATYRFTPRLSGTARAEHRYYDTTRDDRQQNWALDAIGDLNYVLTPKHTVGVGVRYIRQDFKETDDLAASVSDTYNGYASWRYQVTENTVFSAAVGPSFIQVASEDFDSTITGVTPIPVASDVNGNQFVYLRSSCPALPSGQLYIPSGGCGQFVQLVGSDITNVAAVNGTPITISNNNAGGGRSDDLTVFGNLTLSQRWTENLASALRYDRSQGTASGLGGTVTLDAVSFSTTWDFAERWQFALRGDWTHRKSVADAVQVFYLTELAGASVPLTLGGEAAQFSSTATTGALASNRIETNRWGLAGRVTHRVWRHTSVFLQLAYNEQDSKASSLGSFSDFDDWLVNFGVRHVFEPIKLW